MQLDSGVLCVLAGLGAAACVPPDLDHNARLYSDAPAPFVLCASNIDDKYDVANLEIDGALVHARDTHTTVHFYTHDPGRTVKVATIEHVLQTATALGLRFARYDELDDVHDQGALALSFDDDAVDDWTALGPMFGKYGAHVTFFVTRYLVMSDERHAELHQLAADGHDVEYHTVSHQNAVDYVKAHGLDGYVNDEILPALTAMRLDGFSTHEFAYPFGAHDAEIDDALAPYFDHLRAIITTCPRPK